MDTIVLSGKRELDIYMNPQRQNLIRCMQIAGAPMTAKQIADQIGISASSVQHHIRLLSELGLIEQSHTEQIHGITARYYRILPKNIQIGSYNADEHQTQRRAILQAEITRVFSGLVDYYESNPEIKPDVAQHGDMLSGITHLRPEEAAELYAMIRAFLDEHEEGKAGTDAWEYALIAYPVENKTNE